MSNYCFTGTFKVNDIHFERDALIKLAQENGHTVHKHVRKDTDFLVIGSHQTPTTKFKAMLMHKAVKCTSPEFFLKHMGYL
jgi:NAD-dependent DNA ligase